MKKPFVDDWQEFLVRYNRPSESLPNLPVELICNILSHLECVVLLRCQLVCKLFRRLIVETSRLGYTVELHKHRMLSIVPPNNTSTYASRLELLRERELNWRMLAWKRRCKVDLPPTGSLYEFVGGVYANGKEGENRVTASISFLELPSLGIQSSDKDASMVAGLRSWAHIMPDYNIIDFTMDPVQDLLVLVVVAPPESSHVYDLHIRSIKTNRPHPKAARSVFPCLQKPDNQPHPTEVVTAVRVQVCGDLVALLIKEVFDSSGGYLEMWNWHNGPSQSCKMPRTNGIDDFTFLTHEVCLIVRPTGRFEVYDFIDPQIRSSEPVMRYAFAFPALSPGYTYWYISLSSNPTPGYVPSTTDQNNMDGFLKGHQQIHHPMSEERVHACCLYVFNPTDPVLQGVSSFVFFIKIDSLLNPPYNWFNQEPLDEDDPPLPYYNWEAWVKRRWGENLSLNRLERYPARFHSPETSLPAIDLPVHGLPASPPAHINEFISEEFIDGSFRPANPIGFDTGNCEPVPWEIWGPHNTRWFEECLSTDWQHAIYGMRAVETVEAYKMIHERGFDIQTWPPPKNIVNTEGNSSTSGSPQPIATQDNTPTSTPVPSDSPPSTPSNELEQDNRPRRDERFLRMRDFSPYALTRAARLEAKDHPSLQGKGKCRAVWRTPKVVDYTTRVNVKGVFKDDIMSSLPFVETVTDETFDMTDVMMDDCRILLLKRATQGKISQMEVLML